MSFLKKIFKAKPGGSKLGNLFRSAVSVVPIVGKTASAVLTAAQQKRVQVLADRETTFAGQSATQSADGTFNISQPLNEVTVSSPLTINSVKEVNPVLKGIGDVASYLGGRATEKTTVGADNKTLLIVGGGLAALIIAILATKK